MKLRIYYNSIYTENIYGITKNTIPILEYDNDKNTVIMPTHEHLDIKLPKKAIYAFWGDVIDEYARTHNAKK